MEVLSYCNEKITEHSQIDVAIIVLQNSPNQCYIKAFQIYTKYDSLSFIWFTNLGTPTDNGIEPKFLRYRHNVQPSV